jgi:hypothetical protein
MSDSMARMPGSTRESRSVVSVVMGALHKVAWAARCGRGPEFVGPSIGDFEGFRGTLCRQR